MAVIMNKSLQAEANSREQIKLSQELQKKDIQFMDFLMTKFSNTNQTSASVASLTPIFEKMIEKQNETNEKLTNTNPALVNMLQKMLDAQTETNKKLSELADKLQK